METLNNNVLSQKYASDFSIPLELAQVLANRFPQHSEAKKFLFPELAFLHDPKTIPDIEKACGEIMESLSRGESILIYSHDDADGYTSAAIMYKTLVDLQRPNTGSIFFYPIVREKDGYILNPTVLNEYKEKGVRLVITVDFGISSEQNFRIAQEEQLKLVVCDHHETNLTDFPVRAVNPKRRDSKYPFRELAGVGVSFKLAQSLYQMAFKLEPEEFYRLKKDFFPLVMIGTISDRVVLRDENRLFCTHGLCVVNQCDEPWVRCFRKGGEIGLTQITDEVIPLLASASYLDPRLGVEILSSHDENYVGATIAKLSSIDNERRQLIDSLFKEAVAAAKIFPNIVISVIPFSKSNYFGAVSSRLRDYFKRTSVVINLKNGKCFGELRSHNLNLYMMLSYLSGLFLDFGGHQKAAGFSMVRENLDLFVDEAVTYATERTENIPTVRLIPEAFLDKSDINILAPIMPFGEGNPAPILTDGLAVYTVDNRFKIIDLALVRESIESEHNPHPNEGEIDGKS